MERTIFLQHYRVGLKSDGTPREISRDGAAATYEAVDERTREQVDLKLIPLQSIEPGVREQLDEKARVAQNMRHVNIAKVFDFGREGGDLVCISEHLPGETLAAWVTNHGPMPADAALRVAEQIVSVLSSASFHRLPYPPIDPSDIIVVPGQTPEGTWPLVKLINFGLPAVAADSKVSSANSESHEEVSPAQQLVSSEQLTRGMIDIRSEIYSLGATLYFLLTGVALSAEPSNRPKLSRFPKPLRMLLGRLLHRDPDQRPKDLIVLAEMIRECLKKIERRRARAEKYGIPYRATFAPRKKARLGPFVRVVLPLAAVLIVAGVLAALLLPEPLSRVMHPNSETKEIGVLVGVPESSRNSAVQNPSSANSAATAASSNGATAGIQGANQPPANAAVASHSSDIPPADVQQNQTTTAESQATAPKASKANSPTELAQSSSSAAAETNPAQKSDVASRAPSATSQPSSQDYSSAARETGSLEKSDVGPREAVASQSSSQSKKKSVASASSRRPRTDQSTPDDFTQRGSHSVRARVVGITSDGRFILRLPSGRTAIIAPDGGHDEAAPRRHRRPYAGRDEMFAPPPRFEPDFSPDD